MCSTAKTIELDEGSLYANSDNHHLRHLDEPLRNRSADIAVRNLPIAGAIQLL